MKRSLSIFLVFGWTSFSGAQEVSTESGRALQGPETRRSVIVESNERNPFGKIETKIAAPDLGAPQPATEESRLRATILRMPVRGHSISDSNSSVILGNLALSAGDELPSLFPGQMERIVVKEITPDKLTFGFLERDGSSDLRAFSVNFSVAPRIRYALPSDVMDADWGRRPYPLRGRFSSERHESRE